MPKPSWDFFPVADLFFAPPKSRQKALPCETANTEVANQKIVDTGASRLGRGVLAIVEAEFYRLP